MAKYVREERLRLEKCLTPYDTVQDTLDKLIDECQELNPWMTLEEFLKSGFEGECWICTREKEIIKCNFNGVVFSHGRRSIISVIFATHVQPIHKPEPPKL